MVPCWTLEGCGPGSLDKFFFARRRSPMTLCEGVDLVADFISRSAPDSIPKGRRSQSRQRCCPR
jgi:hypothetical protein